MAYNFVTHQTLVLLMAVVIKMNFSTENIARQWEKYIYKDKHI